MKKKIKFLKGKPMNIQSRFVAGSVATLAAILAGIIVGSLFQWLGFITIDVTSSRFWIAAILIYGSLFVQHLVGLHSKNALEFVLHIYVSVGLGLVIAAILNPDALRVTSILIIAAIYAAIFCALYYGSERKPIKTMLNAIPKRLYARNKIEEFFQKISDSFRS
jgi:hypothetical protein